MTIEQGTTIYSTTLRGRTAGGQAHRTNLRIKRNDAWSRHDPEGEVRFLCEAREHDACGHVTLIGQGCFADFLEALDWITETSAEVCARYDAVDAERLARH